MTQNASIYKKIAKVMSEVNRVPKNGYNSFNKYKYATESDLTESIRPILNEVGLAFFSNVLEQERNGDFTKVKMEFTLIDLDTSETLKSYYWGEGQDKNDKGLYKAYTGATKYFFMKTFLIPTGDDPEGNEDNQTPKNSKSEKMATDKQLDLVKRLIIEVANSTESTQENTYKALKNYIKKDIEWYSEDDATKAIQILNKQKGA